MAFCTAARMFASNATLCACDPGYYLLASTNNGTSSTCSAPPAAGWQVGAVGAPRNQSLYFLAPVLSADVVRRLTQSQAVILEATLAVLLAWLAFCAAARIAGRDPRGEKRLFRTRFWLSRLDFIFHNSHWAVRPPPLPIGSTFLEFNLSICTRLSRGRNFRMKPHFHHHWTCCNSC
jgi:hypothetical protein